jgi:hypothetical protein
MACAAQSPPQAGIGLLPHVIWAVFNVAPFRRHDGTRNGVQVSDRLPHMTEGSRRFPPPWRADKIFPALRRPRRQRAGAGVLVQPGNRSVGDAGEGTHTGRGAAHRRQQSARQGGCVPAQWGRETSIAAACTLFGRVTFQQHSVDRHYDTQCWPTHDYGS